MPYRKNFSDFCKSFPGSNASKLPWFFGLYAKALQVYFIRSHTLDPAMKWLASHNLSCISSTGRARAAGWAVWRSHSGNSKSRNKILYFSYFWNTVLICRKSNCKSPNFKPELLQSPLSAPSAFLSSRIAWHSAKGIGVIVFICFWKIDRLHCFLSQSDIFKVASWKLFKLALILKRLVTHDKKAGEVAFDNISNSSPEPLQN